MRGTTEGTTSSMSGKLPMSRPKATSSHWDSIEVVTATLSPRIQRSDPTAWLNLVLVVVDRNGVFRFRKKKPTLNRDPYGCEYSGNQKQA